MYKRQPIYGCNPDDVYVVIGQKVPIKESADPSGCSCGNGVCGAGEDEFNCPSDCAVVVSGQDFFSPERIVKFVLPIIISVVCFILVILLIFHAKKNKYY